MAQKYIMTVDEFVNKLYLALHCRTLYVMGCFGAPMNAKNKTRYSSNHSYNATATRKAMIQNATSDTFGFDCVNLGKGILAGWNADINRVYGGAEVYSVAGKLYYGKDKLVPECDAKGMLKYCCDVSADFSTLSVGEFLWMDGHCGYYVGNGQAIECSPKWENGVQVSNVANLGYTNGHCRSWVKHGKIRWIDYTGAEISEPTNQKEKIGVPITSGDDDLYSGATISYTVKKGDTLTKIAEKFNSTVDAIASANKIKNVNVIVTGSILKIPTVKADEITTYTVKAGDTLSLIAKKFNTTYLKLAAINGILNPNKIIVGQVIKLK